MVALRLTLLGGFEARLSAGDTLSLPTKRARALLAYLGLQPGHAHQREKLASLLWASRSDEQARDGLRHALHALRRALRGVTPPALLAEGQTLALNVAAVDVDVATFQRHMAERTPQALEQAAELYRGDLLLGFTVSEPLFEEWLVAERERLREMALEALARLLAHQTNGRETEAAIQTAIRLLGLDPLQEAVHRTLMRLYARQGRRGAALKQYQVCVGILQRELGTEPEAETKRLYQELLRRPAEAVKAADSPRDRRGHPAPKGARARLDLPVAETPLFGREAELGRLRQLLAESIEGHGHVATVMGEAGIGKTRLLSALAAEALQRGCRVLMGRCHESDSILPFGPWVDACRRGELSADEELLGALHPTWRAEVARLLPESTAPGLPLPSDSDLRLFEGMTKLVEQMAARGPLVLMLEDLHWADEISLRLLAFVSRRISTWPALVVTTAREEELAEAAPARRTLEELDGHPWVARLTLAPLPRATTMELIRSLARVGSDTGASAQLEAQVWVVSEGNPFVVIETMRAVQDGTILSESTRLPLAERVRAMTAARLERLSAPARQLAAVAAVIGSEFEFPLVQRASGLDEAAAAEGVEELVRRRVMQGVGNHFDFVHHRLQAVVYDRLLPPRRKLLHRSAGEALEALSSGDLARDPLALGRHFREGEVWDKAFTYLRAAGASAMARSAYREATTCFEEARVALGRLPESADTITRALDLRLDLGEALLALGEFCPLRDRLAEAESLAAVVADQPRLGGVWSALSMYYRLVGEPARAIDFGRRALGIAEALGDPALEARTNYPLGLAYRSRGDYHQAVSVFTRNVELLQQSPLRLSPARVAEDLVLSHIQLCIALSELGELERALEAGEEAMGSASATGRPDLIAGGHLGLGVARWARGELDTAIEALGESYRISRRWELRVWRFWAQAPLGDALVLAGRIDEGARLLEESVEEGAFLTHSRALRVTCLAHAYLRQGRLDTARETARRGLDLARRHGEHGHEAWALRLFGELGACANVIDAAATLGHYRAAMELAEPRGMRPLVAHCHLGLGKLYRRTDEREQAREHLATATTMYSEMGMTYWLEKVQAEMRESR
jgi:DNA-binding SARP family transcriptional activator